MSKQSETMRENDYNEQEKKRDSMNKYLVQWVEYHKKMVFANSEEEALTNAIELADENSFDYAEKISISIKEEGQFIGQPIDDMDVCKD